jgi:hypothetical protein
MAQYDFLGRPVPEQPQYDYLNSIQGFSPRAELTVPYSPAGANGTPVPGAPASGFGGYQNPYAWQPWGSGLPADAGLGTKLGSFVGGNAKLFGTGMDFLSKGFGVYAGLQSLGMAKDALAFEKKSFNKNFAAQTSSYNTQMRDRIAGRSYATEAERQAALDEALLPENEKKRG